MVHGYVFVQLPFIYTDLVQEKLLVAHVTPDFYVSKSKQVKVHYWNIVYTSFVYKYIFTYTHNFSSHLFQEK